MKRFIMMEILSPAEIADRAGGNVNALLTIVAVRNSRSNRYRYLVSDYEGGPHDRVKTTIEYLDHLFDISSTQASNRTFPDEFVFQAEDIPVDSPSVSWECRAGWKQVRLVPDIYYFSARGYEDFTPSVSAWSERHAAIVWRGSTTGRFGQLVSDLDDLPRYRLCRMAEMLGAGADMGLTEVVQAAHPQHELLIRERLQREGLLKQFVPMESMGASRFIVDIDGNSNSWNFMMKLRLGCCVLRVDSEWQQWFSHRLSPWEHFVPIAGDLSDFVEKAQWCLSNPRECEWIAANGRNFAYCMKFEDEMLYAANVVYSMH